MKLEIFGGILRLVCQSSVATLTVAGVMTFTPKPVAIAPVATTAPIPVPAAGIPVIASKPVAVAPVTIPDFPFKQLIHDLKNSKTSLPVTQKPYVGKLYKITIEVIEFDIRGVATCRFAGTDSSGVMNLILHDGAKIGERITIIARFDGINPYLDLYPNTTSLFLFQFIKLG